MHFKVIADNGDETVLTVEEVMRVIEARMVARYKEAFGKKEHEAPFDMEISGHWRAPR